MRLFKCIVDDGDTVFKTFVAAKNRKELLNVYGGNGNFEKVEDVTSKYLTEKSVVDILEADLRRAGWSKEDRTIICALLEQHIDELNRKAAK